MRYLRSFVWENDIFCKNTKFKIYIPKAAPWKTPVLSEVVHELSTGVLHGARAWQRRNYILNVCFDNEVMYVRI